MHNSKISTELNIYIYRERELQVFKLWTLPKFVFDVSVATRRQKLTAAGSRRGRKNCPEPFTRGETLCGTQSEVSREKSETLLVCESNVL